MNKIFNNYKKLAKKKNLKDHQRVGRPNIHIGKDNKELNIFPDIKEKLDIKKRKVICDIGCGCSAPVFNLIEFAKKNKNKLILVDSKEMLSRLPGPKFIKKVSCEFPKCDKFIKEFKASIDYIITYSVLHCIFPFDSIYNFLDKAVLLLKPGGKMLVGDVPNITKKKRFLSSTQGKKFYQQWSGKKKVPKVFWNQYEEVIDEGIVFSILQRYRNMGCETYLLPQEDDLPFNKTREDILIVKL